MATGIIGKALIGGSVVLVAAFFLAIMGAGSGSGRSAAVKPAEARDSGAAARAMCKQVITMRLHDEDSADWGQSWDWATTKDADGTWSVLAKYSAKNGFNATRSVATHCRMREDGGDRWNLVSLTTL